MVSLAEEKQIYLEIQKRLFYIIPEKWESVYLYFSMIEEPRKRPVGEMYFYYFPKGIIKKKPVNCYEIPNAFNIDEDEYIRLIRELYNTIKNLRQIWVTKKQKSWSNLTISIENFQFKVEYNYDDLKNSPFDSYERHVIWRFHHVESNIDLLPKKDRKIIEKYAQYISQTKLPKKDLYSEGMYNKPVGNIVDFEKTLSVEEAIAQSEREEPKQKKTPLLKKKRVIEDIIEVEEEDGVNNQILNWRKR